MLLLLTNGPRRLKMVSIQPHLMNINEFIFLFWGSIWGAELNN